MPGGPWVKFFTATGDGWHINLSGGATEALERIPVGRCCIFDYLALRVGPMRWTPRDTALMVPVGQSIPQRPEGYEDGMLLSVLFQGYPLARLTSSSGYVNNALFAAHMAYSFAAQAAAGMLAVYETEPSESVFNAKFAQSFFKPKLRLIGWVLRDLDTFGVACVRPPSPLVPSSAGDTVLWPPDPPAITQTPVPEQPPVPPPPSPPPPSAQTIFTNIQPASAASAPITPVTLKKVLPLP
jgi:hypothetical protein